MPYRCVTCGEVHDDLPDLGADQPDPCFGIPEAEWPARVQLTADTCIIDGTDRFIRGVIPIPVRDHPEPFGLGVWVSQSRPSFDTSRDHFNSAAIGPFFGWLCTHLAFYPATDPPLKTMVHFRGGKLRPLIELEPTDHPLAVDQREGISLDRAWGIVHQYLPLAGEG